MPNRLVLEVDLWVGGDVFRIKTNAGDQLRAERALGASPADHPMEQVYQVWYSAFKRRYPDHPAAKAFGTFVDQLEANEDVSEPDELDPLVPTRPADSDG